MMVRQSGQGCSSFEQRRLRARECYPFSVYATGAWPRRDELDGMLHDCNTKLEATEIYSKVAACLSPIRIVDALLLAQNWAHVIAVAQSFVAARLYP